MFVSDNGSVCKYDMKTKFNTYTHVYNLECGRSGDIAIGTPGFHS